jgi:hypothetical protein
MIIRGSDHFLIVFQIENECYVNLWLCIAKNAITKRDVIIKFVRMQILVTTHPITP